MADFLTHQEIFERAATHLLKQGVKARTGDGCCAYRGAGGTMCAVGCLIPDRAYNSANEGAGIDCLLDRHQERARMLSEMLTASGLDVTDPGTTWLLSELQRLHDRRPTSEWQLGLRSIADRAHVNGLPGKLDTAFMEAL